MESQLSNPTIFDLAHGLHHVVHPAVMDIADIVTTAKRIYPGIDESYYLSGDNAGRLNAFEEYAVRVLTVVTIFSTSPSQSPGYSQLATKTFSVKRAYLPPSP